MSNKSIRANKRRARHRGGADRKAPSASPSQLSAATTVRAASATATATADGFATADYPAHIYRSIPSAVGISPGLTMDPLPANDTLSGLVSPPHTSHAPRVAPPPPPPTPRLYHQDYSDLLWFSPPLDVGSDQAFSHRDVLRDETRRAKAIELGYEACKRITAIYSKTFYLGTQMISPEKAKNLWAVYVWCRRTDDLVDSPRALITDRQTLANQIVLWEQRLANIWRGRCVDVLDSALADTRDMYPSLAIEPFQDMIKGMLMDLDQQKYRDWNELYLYCYRVAGTVGLMTLPILGTSRGARAIDAAPHAVDLGIAFQITNILRDVGEDADRGRIYLPQEDLQKFGVSERDIFQHRVTDQYKELVKYYIQKAQLYYESAERGVALLHPSARLAVQTALDVYRGILTVIERNDYDNLRKRAYVSKLKKLTMLVPAYLKTRSMPQ
ncbi:unnamed protein product [Vitrella brassicaformis CCMP3155]|uniref:15-cis-phytoene synthase n=1 Tax=Vitrella brassicaformis (strain CCMP3155) TaxID=1169540 RepID=A0A0G4F8Z0_VITBC|nr:unnamed protein product [Vitrella brassicaformis CCMP3155]|eukprot:CEM09174.1 unnamed protein product [Vitrella brassicaformis CCMP3155]